MVDDTSTSTTDTTDDTGTGSTDTSSDDAQLPEGVRNVLKAARAAERAAIRAQRAAEARVAEFEGRDKTETQKLADRATAAEKAAADAGTKLLRFQVAADKKLPASLAARLQGSTVEELAADADELLKLLPNGGGVSFDGGARTTADKPADMNDWIRNRGR